jgi:hypothetical protein
MKLKTFEECILESNQGKRHIFLGNGFSRACRNSIFSYDSLFDAAAWGSDGKKLKSAFDILDTRDFEQVMEVLEQSAQLGEVYGFPSEMKKQMRADAGRLRKILVETLAKHHPEHPEEIKPKEYAACLRFLDHFERVYTVNYDLLLYWAFMKGERRHDDGFRDPYEGEPEDYHEEEYVEWKNHENKQSIYYLHGALHLFLDGPPLQKYCWSRTGIKLKTQILEALEKRRYPLIVAAGKSEQKLAKIQRSNYLGHGFRSIRQIGGSLFIYGHSLGDKDDHIIRQIAGNRSLKNLYVGIFGDPRGEMNQQLIAKANSIKTFQKSRKTELGMTFFDSSSANVWGK